MTKRRASKRPVYRLAFEGFGKASSALGHEHLLAGGITHLKVVSTQLGADQLSAPFRNKMVVVNPLSMPTSREILLRALPPSLT